MTYREILDRYKLDKNFTNDEIEIFVKGYTNNDVSDELMTEFIKNIYDNGMTIEQTSFLTNIMMHSGDVVDLSSIEGIKVDKHSTGGVGDKVSIIVAPIVAALGGTVAKMSGRGLGFTGGTLDKLESIPGFDIFLSDERFKEIVNNNKIAIIGQTANLVPADKKIYALRDVTNLVDSMPLIASSIMSKKLATGADAILLDVKCGDAAFMKTQKDAEELASWMIKLGKALGRDVRAEITSMDTPLGKAIGNKNEILESVAFLKGEKVPQDLKDVIYSSASTMLVMSGIYKTEEEAKKEIDKVIQNGEAFKKFKVWIKSQSGNVDAVLKDSFWSPKHSLEVKAQESGYFSIQKAKDFGIAAMKLGAGREKKEDTIDFEAGINLNVKSGEQVKEGSVLFTMYASKPIDNSIVEYLKEAFTITNEKVVKKVILNKM